MSERSKGETARRALGAASNEHARRLGDLIAAPVLSFADVAVYLDLPVSTIQKLRSRGDGPKWFTIGRRLYVRQADFREWIDAMAKSEAA
jgi:predicted DNA-binding transcriptional regulator AlpA